MTRRRDIPAKPAGRPPKHRVNLTVRIEPKIVDALRTMTHQAQGNHAHVVSISDTMNAVLGAALDIAPAWEPPAPPPPAPILRTPPRFTI